MLRGVAQTMKPIVGPEHGRTNCGTARAGDAFHAEPQVVIRAEEEETDEDGWMIQSHDMKPPSS